jgi:ribosomal protein S11
MKKFLIIVLAFISAAAFAQESETRSVEAFNGIKVSKGVSVYLKKGAKESVKVEVTGTRLSNVITEVSGSYLKVYMKGDGSYRNVNVKVYVTYVKLEKLSASSAGNIYSQETMKADDMEVSASSAGNIEVVVDVNRIEISASSAGEIEVKGKARSVYAEASSAGELDAYDLKGDKVEVRASSAGSAKVSVVSELRADASTAGVVRYRGNPDKSITDSSSGGSVKQSN